MQRLKYIVFLSLLTTEVFGQASAVSETNSIFRSFITDKRQVFLQPCIDSHDVERLRECLSVEFFQKSVTYAGTGKTVVDTLFLTMDEKHYIDSCIQSLYSFKWTDSEKKQYGLNRFSLVGDDKQKNFSDFNHIVYTIISPIFFRQNTVCFFFYEYACGSLCGHGELMILKKQGDSWVQWLTVFHTDS